jgi:multidrug efflux pump subunit AcrB
LPHALRPRIGYSDLLQLGLRNRIKLIAGFIGFTVLSFGLAPYLGQDFFPSVDGGQIKMHVRAQTGTRIEETTKLADRIGEAIHKIIPADELAGIVDNIGLSVSGINMAYNNSGTIGVEDADILISLKPDHAPTADYVKTMREQLPRQFPGTSFAFLPADIASQILNFGVPAPIDLQVIGNNLQANRAYANALLARIKQIPGIADARIQQAFQQPVKLPKPRRLILVVLIALVAAAAIAANGLINRSRSKQALMQWSAAQAPPTVGLAKLARGDAEQHLILPGDIQPYNKAAIYARVSGYLKS